MALSMALPCYKRVFADLMAEDGLLLMGRGLGIRVVLCRFIMQYMGNKNPVFVVNLSSEASLILDMLESDGVPKRQLPSQLSANTHANERRKVYERGGVIITSSQTLLIDLLANRLEARLVEGLVIHNAHTINENSKEGFALRNLKQNNPHCFVKAFSEDPETLTAGFGRIEKTMRALFVNKLYLWPRFQSQLAADLSHPAEVVERVCELTPTMVEIQRSIVECMDACLRTLKSSSSLDVEAVTADHALFENFEEIIRRQLGSNEHALRPRARAALSDLRTLRKLASFLLRYDAVMYYRYLDTLRLAAVQDGRMPEWMSSEAGDRLYGAARRRMYKIVELTDKYGNPLVVSGAARKSGKAGWPGSAPAVLPPPKLGASALAGVEPLVVVERIDVADGTAAGGMAGAHGQGAGAGASSSSYSSLGFTPTRQYALHMVLEHNPKWAELMLVLDDVREAIAYVQNTPAGKAGQVPSLTDHTMPGAAVLIVTRDDRTAEQIKTTLELGPHALLHQRFIQFLTKDALRTRGMRKKVQAMYAGLEAEVTKARSELGRADGQGMAGAGASFSSSSSSAGAAGSSANSSTHSTTHGGPWYTDPRFLNLPSDIREILLSCDALGHDPGPFARAAAAAAASAEAAGSSGSAGASAGAGVAASDGSTRQGGAASGLPYVSAASGAGATSSASDAAPSGSGTGIASGYTGTASSMAGAAGTGGTGRPTAQSVFVTAEQRLLWKATARELSHAFEDHTAAHARIVAQYIDASRAAAAAEAAAKAAADAAAAAARAKAEATRAVGAVDGDDGSSAAAVPLIVAPVQAPVSQSTDTIRAEFDALVESLKEVHGLVKARQMAAKLIPGAAKALGGLGKDKEKTTPDKAKRRRESGPTASQAAAAGASLQRTPGGTVTYKRARKDGDDGDADDDANVVVIGDSPAKAGRGAAASSAHAGNNDDIVVRDSQGRGPDNIDSFPADEADDDVIELQDGLAGAGAGAGHGSSAGGHGTRQDGKTSSVTAVPRLQTVVFPLSQMDSRYPILADLRPNFIIVYDLDPLFIREVEVYTASTLVPKPFRMYTLSYASSAEEAKYLRATEMEHSAFEKLIDEKAHMALAAPRASASETAAYVAPDSSLVIKRGAEGGVDSWGMNLKPAGVDPRNPGGIAGALSVLTGGKSASAAATAAGIVAASSGSGQQRPRVIMDMRELRSKLPSLLDQHGIGIEPLTIEVGDYVLTPDIVVERKAIPDLISSLNSGRLYNQCEAMTRYYKIPVLLIEFDSDKPCMLVDNVELPAEIDQRDVRSKLVLLTLHFPTLRILWSRSPHTTVNIFQSLKRGQLEPDPDKAVMAGTEEDGAGAGAGAGSGAAAAAARDSQNLAAIDLLRKLPGVTAGNYRAIMARLPSLAAVAQASQEVLTTLMGAQNATLLYRFLHERKAAAVL